MIKGSSCSRRKGVSLQARLRIDHTESTMLWSTTVHTMLSCQCVTQQRLPGLTSDNDMVQTQHSPQLRAQPEAQKLHWHASWGRPGGHTLLCSTVRSMGGRCCIAALPQLPRATLRRAEGNGTPG
jgi:hypothetical protein